MLEQNIKHLLDRKSELEMDLGKPEVTRDAKKMSSIGKELQRIALLLDLYSKKEKAEKELYDFNEILGGQDADLKELAGQELPAKKQELESIEEKLKEVLTPKDPTFERDSIIEIRAGAGGDEAGLFAVELQRMYLKYAEGKKWKTHILSSNRTGVGGYKEVIFEIHGESAYGTLHFESGVHRVQRVPATEKSGRVHTSTVTVAIMPIVEEEDVKISPDDLKIEATTASGHGGQSVNTTYSAIRMTHIPTGIVVSCQDERSQKQNKEKALEVIRARVYAQQEEKRRKDNSEIRKGQIGTGDRSEKIRTYNFPQDRLTDHRIKENFHGLTSILEGNLEPIIAALQKASQK